MGKKVKEYKSGDFIFAKVKGYPAWPARVQKPNGKKYFVYFYGTGETANLPPNMIFDYAENKDKFLTKTVKRRDFNDGVKQIEHDFANNVPLEEVIGVPIEMPPANDTGNESMEAMDDTVADTTADDTLANNTTLNATQANETVEDSDDTGALVIDEGKQKPAKKGKPDPKPKETPTKPAKEPKTPRGKGKKEAEKEEEDEKKEDEIVSRSGRKIRPKRYADEQTEDNATLPSPAPKKRRGASPTIDKEKIEKTDKNIKQFNTVLPSELEGLKEPFKSDDSDKENILIAYLPSGQYVGIKLFQSKPTSFKNESARLQWDKQAAANALTLKTQLEKGHITSQSVLAQLVTDLNLTDEEKATLDKERETEEKKSRVQFLKTEMKLIELDAKIKTCLCLEKADTEMCLKLLDEFMELEVKPLMLLKHPTCLETVKRMRAYVGNTPSWELSETAALVFSKQAHRIRKQADSLYKTMKELFVTPEGLSFWEFFTERVLQFKKATAKLNADELLEMIHEPLEMSVPTSHTMKTAIEAANNEETNAADANDNKTKEEPAQKKKASAKSKKANSTPTKPPLKRQSSRKQQHEEKNKEIEEKEPENTNTNDTAANDTTTNDKTTNDKTPDDKPTNDSIPNDITPNDITPNDTTAKDTVLNNTTNDTEEQTEKPTEETNSVENSSTPDNTDVSETPKDATEAEVKTKEVTEEKKADKEDAKSEKESGKEEKQDAGEPRAKRSRDSKKTEPPPPRSPAKRKAKN